MDAGAKVKRSAQLGELHFAFTRDPLQTHGKAVVYPQFWAASVDLLFNDYDLLSLWRAASPGHQWANAVAAAKAYEDYKHGRNERRQQTRLKVVPYLLEPQAQ